ncbi:hypothetical protein DZA65_03225 [Dickeya dianthicola]|uniref:hypothetical protein n=1 Tax=Dickeya dianthicola TaxID=204039 RepID=UPI000CD48892|nr:hypothetical protein [Dickeya dianthicola]AYC20100.1 hypothetical protein DZA65_03225 [Dickeya dianthicola]MBI0438415.1 hypothetical protein [Dickeya dianthicola]MBI0450908.1 hypothetical protein [Dickeya dianthicola]MBI0454312.1 hypothetical protein [Dickeya dianthicola]MBI0458529.1 hypothetical protein [Dickeya dianthicola]
MTAVTRYTLAARIADLESRQRSLKEDFQLEAYRMLMRGECLHDWSCIGSDGENSYRQCSKCGDIDKA